MKTLSIQKKDTDVVVIEKIARRVANDVIKNTKTGEKDPTSYTYQGSGGSGFGNSLGTGLTYTIYFHMYGVSGSPGVATYAQRKKLTANGGLHLYDKDGADVAEVRLNPVNNPMVAFTLL